MAGDSRNDRDLTQQFSLAAVRALMAVNRLQQLCPPRPLPLYDCWRFVPPLTVSPCDEQVIVRPGQRIAKRSFWPAVLHSLQRIRSLIIVFGNETSPDVPSQLHSLDVLSNTSLPQQLSSMVWGDRADAIQQPWKDAAAVQSLELSSLTASSDPDKSLHALSRALPSLTHLHLPDYQSSAQQHIAQHLSDRLTFLRLSTADLPLFLFSFSALQCRALQSLYITLDATSARGVLYLLDSSHLPQLREITLANETEASQFSDNGPPVILPTLPATLTYLQASSRIRLVVVDAARVHVSCVARRAAAITALPQPYPAR